MLKTLHLTNFRKHLDCTLSFSEGLQVIRGDNESGKSTLAEAILYALYGATMLRTPLEETVTWGEKPSKLKVELSVLWNGKEHIFKRSSAGAEVTCGDQVVVTGQREVSNFSTQLFGVDGRMMQRLIFASQNGIRGALEEGPKAVAQHIESLCNFDIFDTIIEKMQEKLAIGSTVAIEERLASAKARLAATPRPTPIDPDALLKSVADAEAAYKKIDEEHEKSSNVRQGVYAKLEAGRNAHKAYDELVNWINEAEVQVAEIKARVDADRAEARSAPDRAVIEAAKARLDQFLNFEKRRNLYNEFLRLPYPSEFWEGDRQSLDCEIDKARKESSALRDSIQALDREVVVTKGDVKALRSRIVTALTCPTCGQDIRDKEKIAQQNLLLEDDAKAMEENIAAKLKEIEALRTRQQAADKMTEALNDVLRSAEPVTRFHAAHSADLDADLNFVPPKLSWKGDVPKEGEDGEAIRKQLADLQALQDAAHRAEGRAEVLQQTLVEKQGRIREAKETKEALGPFPDIKELEAEFLRTSDIVSRDFVLREEAQKQVYITQNAATEALETFKASRKAHEEATFFVSQAEKELAEVSFNNALLKKIRAIRPQIADQLWSRVLASASVMFSRIRGEQSIITKDKDGFKVNGQAVESLSGSTLDALGVAIRTALSRTFLPYCGFALLDEPGAACDSDRVQSLIGFLASAGFDQTILITHDPISESFADNLVVL